MRRGSKVKLGREYICAVIAAVCLLFSQRVLLVSGSSVSENDIAQQAGESESVEAVSTGNVKETGLHEGRRPSEDVIEVYMPTDMKLTTISLGQQADVHSEEIPVWNQGASPMKVSLQSAELLANETKISEVNVWLEFLQEGMEQQRFPLQVGTTENITEFVLDSWESREETVLGTRTAEDGIKASDYVLFRVNGSIQQAEESCIEDGDLKIRLVFKLEAIEE